MKVSISEYRDLARDGNMNPLPLGGAQRIACQVRTAVGLATALGADTRFVRIATDTFITTNINGGAAGANDEVIPANSVEYFAVKPGIQLDIQLA